MSLRHPFDRLSSEQLVAWLVALGIGTALTGTVVGILALPPATLIWLLDLLTAGSVAEVERLVSGWSVEDRIRVAFLGGFDFLFGLLWTSAFAVACALGSRVFRSGLLADLGSFLVWLAFFAYLLDFPENLAYVGALHGTTTETLRAVGAIAFRSRFAIFFLLDAYVSLALLTWGVTVWRARRRPCPARP